MISVSVTCNYSELCTFLVLILNTVQHKTLVGENFGGFETARKLKKILAADHTNNSSLFELTRTYNIWWIKLWQIANCPPNLPKFCAVQ